MSEYHILESAVDGKTVRVVFHCVLTAGEQAWTNAAGKTSVWCILRSRDLSSQLPNFATDFPDEYQDMQDGKVTEGLQNVRFSSINLTAAQKRAEIEAAYTAWRSECISDMQKEFQWYGYDNDVT